MTNLEESFDSAYEVLRDAEVRYHGQVVGSVASHDPKAAANYAECFVRDFVPHALTYLLDGKSEVVRNFLNLVLKLRDLQEELEGHQNLPKVMPASFRVIRESHGKERLQADFGQRAIGRVAPVDSMMWWVILTAAYNQFSGDAEFAQRKEVQRGIRTILNICLRDRFEVFPTLLVPDASFMIDRPMGVFGHPLEIQSLFCGALRAGIKLLAPDDAENRQVLTLSRQRLHMLTAYVRKYYWLDPEGLNEIHRYENEHFGHDSGNQFNIYPDSLPDWLMDWLPDESGYLLGNLGPGRMDARFFSLGNLLAILFDLVEEKQAQEIMNVFELRWWDLIGMMPVKICYPAVHDAEWRLLTGSDPKNAPWCYHNGGNWPCLLWAFVGAAVRTGRLDMAERAMDVAASRLRKDGWPEYYDGRNGRLIGRRASMVQTWSASALVLAGKFIHQPELVGRLRAGLSEA